VGCLWGLCSGTYILQLRKVFRLRAKGEISREEDTQMAKRIMPVVALFALLMVSTGLLVAQIKSSSMVGSVTDTTGAVVPDAEVSVTNESTNVVVQVKTDHAGEYTMPYLAPGRYTLTVKKEGFSAFRRTGVTLGSAERARVDARLQVGSLATTVEVKAERVNLQTESSTLQDKIDDRVIPSVPDINHNPLYFATLQPGVVARNELIDTTSSNSFGIGIYSRDALSAISVNGARRLPMTSPLTGSAYRVPR
jgi:hypothetical protein